MAGGRHRVRHQAGSYAPVMRYIIGLIVDRIFAFACSAIAGGKGRGRTVWGILGFFFSLITLIVVLIIPRKHHASV
jgi:hypothetical protein